MRKVVLVLLMTALASTQLVQAQSGPLEVVGKMFEAFGKGDMEGVKKTVADNSVWVYEGPAAIPYTGTYKGKDGAVQFITAIVSNVEILDFNVNKLITKGNTVVALGYEKQKIRKNGKVLEQNWVQVYTVENGLITRMEEYANTSAAEKLF